MCSTGPWTVICRETSVSTTTVRDILPHLASCWIQGTVHSHMELSGIQQYPPEAWIAHYVVTISLTIRDAWVSVFLPAPYHE